MPLMTRAAEEAVRAVAHHHAPCGLAAVEEAVRQACRDYGVAADRVEARKVGNSETVQVTVTAGDQSASVDVCNPPVNFRTWAQALNFIKARQTAAPPHLRGLPHNAGEGLTRETTEWLAGRTRLELRVGDVWVHVAAGDELMLDAETGALRPTERGRLHLGYVTHAGSVAMDRLEGMLRGGGST